jgi:glycosyltransferase involved in cell wall biosynthesis
MRPFWKPKPLAARSTPSGGLGRTRAIASISSTDGPASDVGSQFLQVFDSKWYLEVNEDVAAAGLDGLSHFMAYGEAEGRDPNPSFSTRFYREAYMGKEPAAASPVLHYLRQGRELGFDPNPNSLVNYRRLVAEQERRYELDLPELRRRMASMAAKPLFVIYLDTDDANASARAESMLRAQSYELWVLTNRRHEIPGLVGHLSPEDWRLVWLDGDEILHSSALYHYARVLNESPSADVIYADEDELDVDGNRARPFFKPDWSPDYFESFNYVGAGACLSGHISGPVLSEANCSYDLLLLATEAARKVEHIRQILVHRTVGLDSAKSPEHVLAEIDALGRRLRRTRRAGVVTPIRPDRACYNVRLNLTSNPLVSIVIPTAGNAPQIGGRRIDLLFNCLEKVAENTSYRNVEIIVVHNGDLGDARLENLVKTGVKTHTYHGNVNIARKLNIGVAAARGDYLLLMNDDIEPIAPDWVERMLEHFEKPHVGVVGAKLLFPNMKIQHAGVVVIRGKPDHLRFKFPKEDDGYYFSTCAVRNFSAVTGAIMMTRASLYRKIGGYTEDLPINFNDVDYCFKAKAAGYTTVYAPRAELIHYESMSRTRSVDAGETEFFEQQWGPFTADPYYNYDMLNSRGPRYQVVPLQRPI